MASSLGSREFGPIFIGGNPRSIWLFFLVDRPDVGKLHFLEEEGGWLFVLLLTKLSLETIIISDDLADRGSLIFE